MTSLSVSFTSIAGFESSGRGNTGKSQSSSPKNLSQSEKGLHGIKDILLLFWLLIFDLYRKYILKFNIILARPLSGAPRFLFHEGGCYNTGMKGYVINIEKASLENGYFRRVLYTAKSSQLVVMSLKPGEEIGEEIHHLDQFIRIEAGNGKAILDGKEHEISDGFAVVVPAGVKHNIINTSTEKMKLYTVYSPPNHRDGVIHETKEEAEKDDEHFDGKTTE